MPNLTQDYQRLLDAAAVELPGATDAAIKQALYEVMHEFFEETNCWTERISVPIVANTTTYTLAIAEGGEFMRLMDLLNSHNIGQPVISDVVGNITLRDTPNAADTWTAIISKTIGIPVDREGKPEIPEWVVSRWRTVLSAGLLGRMMMQPKKPYYNQTMGQYWLRRFRNRLGNVKSANIHGNLYGANTWRYPTSFATRGQRSGSGGTDQSFGSD